MKLFEIIFNGVSVKTESTLTSAKQFAKFYCTAGETAEIVYGAPGVEYDHVCWIVGDCK